MTRKLQAVLILVIALFYSSNVFSQALTYEIPLAEQVQRASQIIEGKVISKESFWDTSEQQIYTVNKVEVYKVFKGTIIDNVEIITPGGSVGPDVQVVTPSLELSNDDIGVFILEEANVALSGSGGSSNYFSPYASQQSFYKYNLFDDVVANTYKVKTGISSTFYQEVSNLVGEDYNTVRPYDVNISISQNNSNVSQPITTFSPTTITAGTGSILTINGFAFGATQGTVSFADADTGGSTNTNALDSQIVSWSDTQILVEVPSKAGTGTIRVIPSSGGVSTSTQDLFVPYAEINFTSTFGTGVPTAYQTQHFDQNGSGGMTWQMQVDFDSNVDAKASFLRAFDTWVCETGINWVNGAITFVDSASLDGTNVIRFDNGTELPAGVLGRNTTYAGACSGGGQVDFFVTELDIVFNDSTNWQFGPTNAGGSQIDFESVAVHELGHGHQLAHVIDSNAIMHFAIGPGTTSRVLSQNDIDAGNDVQLRSVNNPVCGEGAMTNSACSLSLSEFGLNEQIVIYPTSVKENLFIENALVVELESFELIDTNGKVILSRELTANTSLHKINLEEINAGIYFLKVKTISNNQLVKKIIKE